MRYGCGSAETQAQLDDTAVVKIKEGAAGAGQLCPGVQRFHRAALYPNGAHKIWPDRQRKEQPESENDTVPGIVAGSAAYQKQCSSRAVEGRLTLTLAAVRIA